MYDVVTFIGRFQPFHQGHKEVVDRALLKGKKVNISLGSHAQAVSARNPFTTKQRIEMISAIYPNEVASGRIFFSPQVDYRYSLEKWIIGVQSAASTVANTPFTPDPVSMALIGHSKDKSSFYLRCFPTWDSIEVPNNTGLDATTIRQKMFTGDVSWVNMVPKEIVALLTKWTASFAFTALQEENTFVEDYKKQWKSAPYAPTFVTVDAVVTQSGHVLMIQRGAMPGKGLWALPGGFLEQYETVEDGAIRELREETSINISDETLRRAIRGRKVFDDPWRSQRGRTITHAFHFDLRKDTKLTDVKGGDDAVKAQWVPIDNLIRGPESVFEDHVEIITTLVGAW